MCSAGWFMVMTWISTRITWRGDSQGRVVAPSPFDRIWGDLRAKMRENIASCIRRRGYFRRGAKYQNKLVGWRWQVSRGVRSNSGFYGRLRGLSRFDQDCWGKCVIAYLIENWFEQRDKFGFFVAEILLNVALFYKHIFFFLHPLFVKTMTSSQNLPK